MEENKLPMNEVSIGDLFVGSEVSTYEIPIYQRNYAWGKEEIDALVQDVYDAFSKRKPAYFIGTLVSYPKGDRVFEIIDGQQRLTTIFLVLSALNVETTSKLTYRARKKSDDTLRSLGNSNAGEVDQGIIDGFEFAKNALNEIDEREEFRTYFQKNVHIIHYRVPKDIDLNHYFEIMNSRGEQLEKHEIVKAKLMGKLQDADRSLFNWIWESCSEMGVYIQKGKIGGSSEMFGKSLCEFPKCSFDELRGYGDGDGDGIRNEISIDKILADGESEKYEHPAAVGVKDEFQPIIDFPNLLLIVLKLTLVRTGRFGQTGFNLDDKELLNGFEAAKMSPEEIKEFSYNLLKSRFLLDNYIVHHAKEEDTQGNNPWKLQKYCKEQGEEQGRYENLCDDRDRQDCLVQLLSMFEVTFTAKQRKNYLFYNLLFLFDRDLSDEEMLSDYVRFVEELADRYFNEVYLDEAKLSASNTPLPGSFDEVILDEGQLRRTSIAKRSEKDFCSIFGDGGRTSAGVPLFVFNYLDYRLWKKYCYELRGKELSAKSPERMAFFGSLGCDDFGLEVFNQFYFSRTRKSLEHYYAQANTGDGGLIPNEDQINCFGNYAMIGSEANSSGSNWNPQTKVVRYLDEKVNQVSVASLKFRIMLQICSDHDRWGFEEIRNHQTAMVSLMF